MRAARPQSNNSPERRDLLMVEGNVQELTLIIFRRKHLTNNNNFLIFEKIGRKFINKSHTKRSIYRIILLIIVIVFISISSSALRKREASIVLILLSLCLWGGFYLVGSWLVAVLQLG